MNSGRYSIPPRIDKCLLLLLFEELHLDPLELPQVQQTTLPDEPQFA